MSHFGIDFGTTNSVVARFAGGELEVLSIDQPPAEWSNLGFEHVMPSVVAIGDGREPVFGWQARRLPRNLPAVKRLLKSAEKTDMGGETFEVEEIATMLFRQLATASPGTLIDEAVVTVPANSRGVARHRTKVCAGMAGIRVPALINEPTAAAMAASLHSTINETLMVVDWGGGTLDVTVLRNVDGVFIEEASDGVGKLGGLDFDDVIGELAQPDTTKRRSWNDAELALFKLAVERAKIRLSTDEATEVQLPSGEVRRITREEFEQACRRLIDGVRTPVERCLSDLKGAAINRLVLVGGTCNIPAVRRLVSDIVGLEPAAGVNPMTAVAEGAAIAAAILADDLDSNDFFVATEHALGLIALNPATMRDEFSVIIPRNHKLPAKRTEVYTPVNDYQDAVELRVIEGDPDAPLDHEDNVIYAELETHLPGRTMEEGSFDVMFEYDVDGILHITITDAKTQQILREEPISFGAAADPRRRVEIAKRVERTFDSGSLPSSDDAIARLSDEAAAVVKDARGKVLPYIDEDEQKELEALITDTIESGDAEPLRQALQRRWPYLLG